MTTAPSRSTNHFRISSSSLLLAVIVGTWSQNSIAQTYAPWLRQIGINNTIESAAAWGKGQLLGVVDTGINVTHPQFAPGQVSASLSSCAAVSFRCSNGVTDDNGHGTAVASIAAGYRPSQFANVSAGGYTTVAGNFIGVAPAANIVAEKVLAASGSGYSTDVANGIRKAADAGAGVINVSITYGNDSATVSAINYAASKGAFIVWAGGNSAQNLLANQNTIGLTQAAIQRLVFAGSVNSANIASSFTNKPGSGNLVSTTNTRTTYAGRWVMAPGEAIIAPSTTNGNNAYRLWSGTSMAAPVVSGSLMLLQNAWPILKTRGTTADLLIATSTDLGSKGVDSTYGNGLVNLQKAFTPVGALTVTSAKGTSIDVNALTGSLISSGALGSMSSIRSKLANYTAFDSYTRNFTVNLSGLIQSPTNKASLNPLPSNAFSAPKVMKFQNGELAVALTATADPTANLGRFDYRADLETSPNLGYTLFTNAVGSVTGLGYGASASYPFAKAMFNDELIARQMQDFDSASINSIAQNGYQLSYGMQFNPDVRFAAHYSATPTDTPLQRMNAPATQIKLGASYRVSQRLTAGLTYGNMEEGASLLGAGTTGNSLLSFGHNRSNVAGLSLAYRVGKNSSLLFNGEMAQTETGESGAGSLFAATSNVRAQAFGVTFIQQNLWTNNDQLLASVRQPLRVSSGRVAIVSAEVDANGEPVYQRQWASLVPDGREIDFSLRYVTPTGKSSSLAMQAMYQRDALNIAGNNATQFGMLWKATF